MTEKILIFGKDTCPFTRAARKAYAKEGKNAEYINVLSDAGQMDIMLKYSRGSRKVPVIVEGEAVSIGFNGKA